MKKMIIAIHGLGNKPDQDLLRGWWLSAIREGLGWLGRPHKRIPFEMVYWADISFPTPLNPESEDASDPLFLEEPYVASTSILLRRSGRLYPFMLQFAERFLDRLFLKKNLSETLPAISTKIMEHFFAELDEYYTDECRSILNEDCSAKTAIQDRLRSTLDAYAGYDILLLGHSMGSIIAFDVLWDPAAEYRINTLVTMGSPLGIPPIISRNFQHQQGLFPELKQPRVPEGIESRWINLSDRLDKVALDHALADDYAPNKHGLRVEDLMVRNDYQINGKTNPHKSYGYLRTLECAEIIDAFLSGKRMKTMWRTNLIPDIRRILTRRSPHSSCL